MSIFKSKWITTEDFAPLKRANLFNKEYPKAVVENSGIINYHAHFVKEFTLDEVKGNYEILISADDYYKLYINEEFVCQGPGQAYYMHYHYNKADITPFLKKGENIIAIHAYYHGQTARSYMSGDDKFGIICDILNDGKYLFGTDETWLYERAEEYSGRRFGDSGTQHVENIDFRLKNADWKKYGSEKDTFSPCLYPKEADWIFEEEPLILLDVSIIKPKTIIKKENSYVLDFGTEITGQISFSVQGKEGDQVHVRWAEELNEDGTLRYMTRANCYYLDVCTLSGKCDEFEFFDYKAFRYAEIVCDTSLINADEIFAIKRAYPFSEKFTLKTDVPYLAEIIDICKTAVNCCTQETFVDCPGREKGQYLGDVTVIGLSYLYLTGDREMYKKALFDFANSAIVCKGLISVAPSALMQEIADYSLQYPLQVLNYYKVTGDFETLEKLYPVCLGVLEHFKKFEREDSLLENVSDKWNLIDWPENMRDGYSADVRRGIPFIEVHNLINAFYIGANEATMEIEKILNKPSTYDIEKLKKSYLDVFYDKDKKIFYDDAAHKNASLHSNALALFYDAAPEEAYENIRKMIMDKGFVCGVYFSYFVLKALNKIGAYEDEVNLLLNENENSWVNMVREGASACFEAWGKEKKDNTSLCHAWASTPVIALIEDLLGIGGEKYREMSGKTITKEIKQGKIELNIK